MGGTKDIYECTVSEVEGMEESLHYYATESLISLENDKHKVYGIRVEKRKNSELIDSQEFKDVSFKYEDIISFAKLLSVNTVTPVTVGYIVEDYISR